MKWKNKGHEFDETGRALQEKKEVYLYGAVPIAQDLIKLMEWLHLGINWEVYVVDRDPAKQKNGLCGCEVLSPEAFFNREKKDALVVICTSFAVEKEIRELLKGRLAEDIPVYSHMTFLYEQLPIYFLYAHDKVFFPSENMLPSTICNLNCRDCLNFTPYIKKHHVASLEELKRNVDLFFKAVDRIYLFQITGGEPLLYKDLQSLLEYIDQNYRSQIFRLELVTNGTVMPSDSLCAYFKDKNIHIVLDDYRRAVPERAHVHERIREKFSEFQVSYLDNYVGKWFRMYIPQQEHPVLSEEELIRKFDVCGTPWCSLRDGKLSLCNYSMYADTAGICRASEDEFFDLSRYQESDKKALLEFGLRYSQKVYTEFCKQCNTWEKENVCWCDPAIQYEKEREV